MSRMLPIIALGKPIYVGIVGETMVVVDADTWELHRKQCVDQVLDHPEEHWDPGQAALTVVGAPEYWWWCARDGVEGVRLIEAQVGESHGMVQARRGRGT